MTSKITFYFTEECPSDTYITEQMSSKISFRWNKFSNDGKVTYTTEQMTSKITDVSSGRIDTVAYNTEQITSKIPSYSNH